MFQLIIVAAIVGFVVGINIYDHKNDRDDETIYEEWKEENHVKDL